MAIHAHDLLLYKAFPSSLKGVTYYWFYLLPKNSLQSFDDLTNAFCNQFASEREFQRNNNHLLTVRMKPRESLKSYVN